MITTLIQFGNLNPWCSLMAGLTVCVGIWTMFQTSNHNLWKNFVWGAIITAAFTAITVVLMLNLGNLGDTQALVWWLACGLAAAFLEKIMQYGHSVKLTKSGLTDWLPF